MNRRSFLGAALSVVSGTPAGKEEFPLVDYHAHLDSVVTLEKALEISRQRGVKLGIVEHAGTRENHYPGLLSSDADLNRYIAKLDGKPVYKGIQAEGLDWMTCFSKDAVIQLDYVLSDALTCPERDGRRVELWRPWVKVDDKQEFMERYVAFHVEVMRREPIDILANPTFLPDCLRAQHDELWTPERMRKVIAAAVEYGVAFEINSNYRLPKLPFLRMARGAGARFSTGSNIHGLDVGRLDYAIEMAREMGLRRKDFFTPAPVGKKPIEWRSY
jgi:histidinol phosphatase-like PHP family hydrolase